MSLLDLLKLENHLGGDDRYLGRIEGARIALEAALQKRTTVRLRLIGGCDVVTIHELEQLLSELLPPGEQKP